MSSILTTVEQMLPDVHSSSKFNRDDFLAIAQGITAFTASGILGDPFVAIDGALGTAANLVDSECIGTLDSMMDKIKKWLTFGQNYSPLQDSSDLDFSQMDVDSVPEVMQVWYKQPKNALIIGALNTLQVLSHSQNFLRAKVRTDEAGEYFFLRKRPSA